MNEIETPKWFRKKPKRNYKDKSENKNQSLDDNLISIPYEEVDEILSDPNGYELDQEELKRLEIGSKAWNESLTFYHTPPISSPVFIFDRSRIVGFFIDPHTWKTILNLSNTPVLISDTQYLNYYKSMCLHEIGHYIYCPYDLYTNGILLSEVLKAHIPKNLAPVVLNIFSDLIVDMNLYRRIPDIMEFQLKEDIKFAEKEKEKYNKGYSSNIYKLLIKCYEYMWKIDLQLPEKEYEKISPIAKKISEILLKDFMDTNTWRKKIRKIAKLIKDLIIEDFSNQNNNQSQQKQNSQSREKCGNIQEGCQQQKEDSKNPFTQLLETIFPAVFGNKDKNKGKKTDNNEKNKNEDKKSEVPIDIQILMGNPFEIKGKDPKVEKNEGSKNDSLYDNDTKIKDELESIAENLSQETSLDEFIKINDILHLIPKKDVIRIYYRGLSKDLISIKITEKKPSGSIPVTLNVWRLGDPIEQLDIFQSYMVLPKIIPNVTTRKWIYKDGPGIEISLELPDMMIVLDSSGSMEGLSINFNINNNTIRHLNSSSPYHLALVASFAILQYASKKSIKVSAINFSDDILVEKWTIDYRKIENLLLNYQGNGTVLPSQQILKLCREAERKSLIILITDFEIHNWEVAEEDLEKILIMENKFVGFFIGGQLKELNNKKFQKLIELGAKFYVINKVEDLIGLVIKEVKDTYET